MHKVRFILKSGASIIVMCKNARVRWVDNELTGYSLEGIAGAKPMYIRLEDVSAIVDELPEGYSEEDEE